MAKDKSGFDIRRETAPAPSADNGWAPILTLRNEIDRLFESFGTEHFRRPLSQSLQDIWGSPEVRQKKRKIEVNAA